MPAKKAKKSLKKKATRTASLKKFLDLNPASSVENSSGSFIIRSPWGDDSVALQAKKTDKALPAALNNLILPQAFNAIYHTDTKRLEFIFTIFNGHQYKDRSFKFDFEGTSHNCEFAEASDRLLTVAASMETVGVPTTTNYRGLSIFKYYFDAPEDVKKHLTPISFFINNINWDITAVLELARHLNFYMRYFDSYSATILIHEESKEDDEKKEVRYLFESFPKVINGHRINAYLLGLWKAATESADNFLEFLYYYQIIEYAAFYYLGDDLNQKLSRILLLPHTDDFISKSLTEIIEITSENKQSDSQKFDAVIRKYDDPEIIWRAIDPIRTNFTTLINFEGGFSIDPLINDTTSLEDFKTMGMPKVSQQLREIRNAIAHSRDSKTMSVIEPSYANSLKIKPWTNLIKVIASQIMICRP